MLNIWKKISLTGVDDTTDFRSRNIVLSNQLTAVLIVFCLIVSLLLDSFFGNPLSSTLTIYVGITLTLVWVFNYFRLINTSRFFLCYFMSLATMAVALAAKLNNPTHIDEFEFYDSRLFLLGTAMLPFILFDLREKQKLFVALSVGFFLILLYDAIHELFQVGYFQVGYENTRYLFINYAILITYGIIGSAILVLKHTIQKTEEKNEQLINDLTNSQNLLRQNNEDLKRLNQNILERNRSIEHQSEELKTSQEQIFNASQIIAKQREELETKNRMLEVKLRTQDKSLLEVNTELVKRNNELRQFGYTISHNLRGPIASLLGLANLFNKKEAYPGNINIINHIQEVTDNLDIIIRDLNRIVEIRKDAQLRTEAIDLDHELKVVISSMRESVEKANATIHINLGTKNIEGIKAYVHSIFYNLLDNSIKFRSQKRNLNISVSSFKQNGSVYVKVEDNGIGFNIAKHYQDIFQLYKKFHLNTPGRGLGLYLTKLQVETLEGEILANSVEDHGTIITISFPAAPDDEDH
ncbi:MAG: sensor histidine kinase [Candidatus Cyclobacteriaceae bacterium M2_1C_046]